MQVKKIQFELFTANSFFYVVFEPIENPVNEFTYSATFWERSEPYAKQKIKTGGLINKTKAIKILKKAGF